MKEIRCSLRRIPIRTFVALVICKLAEGVNNDQEEGNGKWHNDRLEGIVEEERITRYQRGFGFGFVFMFGDSYVNTLFHGNPQIPYLLDELYRLQSG